MTTCLPLSERHGAAAHEGRPAWAIGTTTRTDAQRRRVASRRRARGIHSKLCGAGALSTGGSAHAGAHAEAELRRLSRGVGHARDEDQARVLLQAARERAPRLQARPAQRDGLLLRGDAERPAVQALLAALDPQAVSPGLAEALRQGQPDALQDGAVPEARRQRAAPVAEAQ